MIIIILVIKFELHIINIQYVFGCIRFDNASIKSENEKRRKQFYLLKKSVKTSADLTDVTSIKAREEGQVVG